MSNYQNYRYGESAVMPEDKPFILAIEGVGAKFELVHRIDDEGRIHMSVDRANPVTDRRSMQDARRAIDDDDGDYDPHTGLLKDGRRIRVPMSAMDSNLRGRGTKDDPIIINTSLNIGREFYPDGTSRRRGGSSRRSRQDDQTTVTDTGRVGDAAGRTAVVDAYNEMVNDMTNAWRGPQTASPPAATADATPPAGVTAAEWAREQGIREMSDAWKPRDAAAITAARIATVAVIDRGGGVGVVDSYSENKPGFRFADAAGQAAVAEAYEANIKFMSDAWRPKDADQSGLSTSTGAGTKTVATRPANAYAPVGTKGVSEGQVCTWNGSPGHLVKEGNFLVCRPDAADAALGTRDAVDQAWRALQEEQQNAWRS